MSTITREEWERRYAARIMEVAGWSEAEAMGAALIGYEVFDLDRREFGETPWDKPEDAADEEMSYWENDE